MDTISLYNAPSLIGDYIIRNRRKVRDVVDLLVILVEMKQYKKACFVFSSDLWAIVLKATLEYVDVQNKFIDDCLDTIAIRKNNPKPAIAHELITTLSDLAMDLNTE